MDFGEVSRVGPLSLVDHHSGKRKGAGRERGLDVAKKHLCGVGAGVCFAGQGLFLLPRASCVSVSEFIFGFFRGQLNCLEKSFVFFDLRRPPVSEGYFFTTFVGRTCQKNLSSVPAGVRWSSGNPLGEYPSSCFPNISPYCPI